MLNIFTSEVGFKVNSEVGLKVNSKVQFLTNERNHKTIDKKLSFEIYGWIYHSVMCIVSINIKGRRP